MVHKNITLTIKDSESQELGQHGNTLIKDLPLDLMVMCRHFELMANIRRQVK